MTRFLLSNFLPHRIRAVRAGSKYARRGRPDQPGKRLSDSNVWTDVCKTPSRAMPDPQRLVSRGSRIFAAARPYNGRHYRRLRRRVCVTVFRVLSRDKPPAHCTGQFDMTTQALTSGIDHVGLAVRDLNLTRDFFVECLQWKQVGEKPDYPAAFVSDGH